MKTPKQVFKMVIELVEKRKANELSGFSYGICWELIRLRDKHLITVEEQNRTKEVLWEQRPNSRKNKEFYDESRRYSAYFWLIRFNSGYSEQDKMRLSFLKHLIKKRL